MQEFSHTMSTDHGYVEKIALLYLLHRASSLISVKRQGIFNFLKQESVNKTGECKKREPIGSHDGF